MPENRKHDGPPDDDPVDPPDDDPVDLPDDDPFELPINGELDLHHFHPRDVKDLVPDYLEECRKRGILEVRIVHGKGIGALRRTVHAVLDKLPYVTSYRQGGPGGGSWGATIANLAPLENKHE